MSVSLWFALKPHKFKVMLQKSSKYVIIVSMNNHTPCIKPRYQLVFYHVLLLTERGNRRPENQVLEYTGHIYRTDIVAWGAPGQYPLSVSLFSFCCCDKHYELK